MEQGFTFDPVQSVSSAPSTQGSLSRFDRQTWKRLREHANERRGQGQGATILEIHSVTGGQSIGVVTHQRVPGSMTGCIWSAWPEALLIERRLQESVLPSGRQRTPSSQNLQGYVMIANYACTSQSPVPMGYNGQNIELALYEREYWLISPYKPRGVDMTGDRYLGFWQPVLLDDQDVLKQADEDIEPDQCTVCSPTALAFK